MSRIILCLLLGLFHLPCLPHSSCHQPWVNHGRDLFNSRNNKDERKIKPTSVSKMKLKWRFVTGFDVTATPAVADGVVYFPSWNGNIYAVTEESGTLVWMKNLTELTGIVLGTNQRGANATLSRTTPTVTGDKLIFGLYGPAVVLAVRRVNGELLWMKQIEHSPGGVITMSGTAYKGGFYIGTSSVEENFPELCCTSQGTFVKLDVNTGDILWRTLMLPDNNGSQGLYSGASVWGSSPSIDVKRNHVYIATGEMHGAPPEIQACQAAQNNKTVPELPNPCLEPGNHLDSILALDLDTGEIKWANQLGGYDAWVASCSKKPVGPDCPVGPNPDFDFSAAPSMLTIKYHSQSLSSQRDIVVAGQKSGVLSAVDRDDGKLIWKSQTGPGGGGGQIWGQAVDKGILYVNIPNSRHKNWTLLPTDTNITTGGWSAVNASTGGILWSVPNPTLSPPIGPLSITNGVLFGSSMDNNGTVIGMDARSGAILWNKTTGATVYGGCSISNGCIFIGTGASVNVGRGSGGTRGDSVYAFCLEPQ